MSQEFEPNTMPYEHTLSVESDLTREGAREMLRAAGYVVRGSEVHLPTGELAGILLPTGMVMTVGKRK